MEMTKETLRNKVRGSMLGVAIGDGLGVPVETMTRAQIIEKLGAQGVTGYIDSVQTKISDTRQARAGTTSDDTQLTLATADALIDYREFDLTSQAKSLATAYKDTFEGLHTLSPTARKERLINSGWGGTIKQAGKDIALYFDKKGKEGRNPIQRPAFEQGKGSGTGVAMRIAPLALFRAIRDGVLTDRLLTDTMELGLMTHSDPRASIAALAIAAPIATAILHGSIPNEKLDTKTIQRSIEIWTEDAEQRFSLLSLMLETSADIRQHRVSDRLRLVWKTLGNAQRLRDASGTGFTALEAVPLAIGTFLRHPKDFRAGVLEAVNHGGDTDTVASMTGAIIGANVGMDGIPNELIKGLRCADLIITTADKLLDAALTPPELYGKRQPPPTWPTT